MSEDREDLHSLVFNVIRRTIADKLGIDGMSLASDVDDAIKEINPNTLAAHFKLPVALSGAPEFDRAVSARVTPCLENAAQGHLELGRREERYRVAESLTQLVGRYRESTNLAEAVLRELAQRNEDYMAPLTGATMIAVERLRQIHEEKFTAEHDDDHEHELLDAAIAYADLDHEFDDMDLWPWGPDNDKRPEKSEVRRLVIAGALLSAEIDRRLRKGEKP